MFHLSGIILSDYGIFALSHLIDSFRLICNSRTVARTPETNTLVITLAM